VKTTVESTESVEAVESTDSVGDDAVMSAEPIQTSSTAVKTRPPYLDEWTGQTAQEVAVDIQNSELEFAEDGLSKLAEGLELDAPGVFNAVKVLVHEGILLDVI